MRVRKMRRELGVKLGIQECPNFHYTGSVIGMRKKFYGMDAKLVKCGEWIYNVNFRPDIWDLAY